MMQRNYVIFLLTAIVSTRLNGYIRELGQNEVRSIAEECMCAEREALGDHSGNLKFGVVPYALSCLDSQSNAYIITVSSVNLDVKGNSYDIRSYISLTNTPFAYDTFTDGNDLYARDSECFLLKRQGEQPTLLFSHVQNRRLGNDEWQIEYKTKRIDFDAQGRPYGVSLPDGGLSLFRSPGFVSIEECGPWILKETNAVVETAPVIPPLTNRVIACSDKAGAVAVYRATRAQTGTNVTGAVSAVFFDVNRDGDCDAYLTDAARSLGGGTNEWSLCTHGTNGWAMATSDFVSDVDVATGEELSIVGGGRPYRSPMTLLAATNDFFAVSKFTWWHSDEYLEIGAPEIEVANTRGLKKLEKLPCEAFAYPESALGD